MVWMAWTHESHSGSTKEMDQIEFEDGSVPISADADAHRAQLARLTKELETRKRYVAMRSMGSGIANQ